MVSDISTLNNFSVLVWTANINETGSNASPQYHVRFYIEKLEEEGPPDVDVNEGITYVPGQIPGESEVKWFLLKTEISEFQNVHVMSLVDAQNNLISFASSNQIPLTVCLCSAGQLCPI